MLNSTEIERELRLLGLRLSKDNERIHELCVESLVVYVKTSGTKSKSVSNSRNKCDTDCVIYFERSNLEPSQATLPTKSTS